MALAPRTLNDGTTIPGIGLGTYPMKGEEAVTAILSALELGYRLIDTAVNYGNERDVGEALRRSGLPREEVVVTTKLPGRHHGYDDALASIEESRKTLGVERVDLHLIHWPNPGVGKYVEAWRALVHAQAEGTVRSIGVSNFTEAQLAEIVDDTGVTPAVNQVELHPYFPQAAMLGVDAGRGIVTEAWSPLGKSPSPFEEAPIRAAAEKYAVTPGQVVLRWHVQLGSLPIPKSGNPERQRQNLDLDGFELTDDEVAAISGLGRADGRRFGGDPDTHQEM